VEGHELDDLVAALPGRRLHLDLVADALVEERAPERRRERYLPLAASASSGKTMSYVVDSPASSSTVTRLP
jgi:hypothetical protein